MEKTEDEIETVVAELVDEPSPVRLTKAERREKQAHERIRAVEDSLMERAQSVVSYTLDFMEIATPDSDSEDAKLAAQLSNDALKRKWALEMGSDAAAAKRFRVALSGWARSAEMPGAIKVAQDLYVGITKARAKETNIHINELNANFISMPLPASINKLLEDK